MPFARRCHLFYLRDYYLKKKKPLLSYIVHLR